MLALQDKMKKKIIQQNETELHALIDTLDAPNINLKCLLFAIVDPLVTIYHLYGGYFDNLFYIGGGGKRPGLTLAFNFR